MTLDLSPAKSFTVPVVQRTVGEDCCKKTTKEYFYYYDDYHYIQMYSCNVFIYVYFKDAMLFLFNVMYV